LGLGRGSANSPLPTKQYTPHTHLPGIPYAPTRYAWEACIGFQPRVTLVIPQGALFSLSLERRRHGNSKLEFKNLVMMHLQDSSSVYYQHSLTTPLSTCSFPPQVRLDSCRQPDLLPRPAHPQRLPQYQRQRLFFCVATNKAMKFPVHSSVGGSAPYGALKTDGVYGCELPPCGKSGTSGWKLKSSWRPNTRTL
jgi:hypothetical protein